MTLYRYIARRVLLLFPMLVGITLLSFLLSHAVPADPVAANLGDQAAADPTIVAAFRHHWGLDQPLYRQYLIYLWNLVHGNMGISISTRQPVLLDLRQHLPATIEIAVAAMLLSLVTGIPLGMLAAVNRERPIDQAARVASLVGVSTPVFWLGLVAIVVFYAHLGWAPAPGRLSPTITPPPFVTGFVLVDAMLSRRWDAAADWLGHLVLPAVVLSSYSLGIVTRMMRGSMLEVLGEDYVRTARAKGVTRWAVVVRHAARNALIPIITIVGLSFGGLLSGAVVTETVFSWPGLGLYAFSSATSLDFPAIMGSGIIVAGVYVLVNLVVDVAYAFFDPRIRVA
ncbi:MAG TPA: ABC transporter permease [bacterium]|jgi:peptide/nickel transport system permease protein|nr:ABC transporter permease [bacterium]